MTTTGRLQQRYDHRLRNLVQRTRDVTIATERGVPRSTARGWLGAAPTVVVSLDVADLSEPELRQELAKLRRRVQKLAALLRLVLALLRTSGFSLRGERLPDGRAVARGPAVAACVAESVPCLAPLCVDVPLEMERFALRRRLGRLTANVEVFTDGIVHD